MKSTLRDRFGFWLERFPITYRWLLKYDGIAPRDRRRYVNRVNGHLVAHDDE